MIMPLRENRFPFVVPQRTGRHHAVLARGPALLLSLSLLLSMLSVPQAHAYGPSSGGT